MQFSINVTDGFEFYRMKENGIWSKVEDFAKVSDGDTLFSTFNSAKNALNKIDSVEIEGVVHNLRKQITLLEDWDDEILVHRTQSPQYILTKEDLIATLINGDDNFMNCLVLDYEGRPELIMLQPAKTPSSLDNYAVRFETYIPHNGYVGKNAHLDDIDDLYRTFLGYWILHLETGRTLYFDCYDINVSEEAILKSIRKFYESF